MKANPFALSLVLTIPLLAACHAAGSGGAPEYRNVGGRSDALPFSHAVEAGSTVYLAGTLGLDPDTGQAPADVETEVRLLMQSMGDKLALVGLGFEDLVSVQIFCPDLSLYDTFNGIYRTYFDEHFPARSFIGSGPLLRNARFEMNAVAVRR